MTERQTAAPPETSSEPMKIPQEQERLFREILELFELRKMPYAVAGAFALQEHTGICRDTKDLDLFLTSENAPVALRLLREKGFECEICDPVWLFKAHRDGFFVDLITGMSNATIMVDDSWIERSKPGVVHGVRTRVLAAEELIASKLFVTRRERFDGADIAHVIYGTKGRLDWQRVLKLSGRTLGNGSLGAGFVPLCLSRADAVMSRLNYGAIFCAVFEMLSFTLIPHAKFRGSLIDDKMFAIDVNEWGLGELNAGISRTSAAKPSGDGQKLMRIAATADLHFSASRHGVLHDQLSQVRDEADVLVLAGDLTNYGKTEEMEPLLNVVVRSRIPTVAVLGNHDYESGKQAELMRMMETAGIKVLDGTAYERDGVGFAGTKGFVGGFGRGVLTAFGEPEIKQFVQASIDEALKLERAMAQLRTPKRVVVIHYSPIAATVQGEAAEIFPFLGRHVWLKSSTVTAPIWFCTAMLITANSKEKPPAEAPFIMLPSLYCRRGNHLQSIECSIYKA